MDGSTEIKRKRTKEIGAKGVLKLAKAAELVGLYRQMKRVWKRYREEGDVGLAPRGWGRASNRRIDEGFRKRALEWHEKEYADFGPTLANEYLAKEELGIDHETLRRWLLEEGLWQKRRRRQEHRQRRERGAHRGELIQMDGSHHDWFEGRRGWAVLIDDVTNRTYARLNEAEDTTAAMDILGRYMRRYGRPPSGHASAASLPIHSKGTF